MAKPGEEAGSHLKAIRLLYGWLGSGAVLLALLIAWALPRSTPRPAGPSPSGTPTRLTLTASLPAPLEPGSSVMASFPELGTTVTGKVVAGQLAGKLVVEFEVPAGASPASLEMWVQSPSTGKSYHWRREAASQGDLGPPSTSEGETAQAPRDISQYRYPQATARPASQKPPPGTGLRLPENARLPSPEQVEQMQAKYAKKPR